MADFLNKSCEFVEQVVELTERFMLIKVDHPVYLDFAIDDLEYLTDRYVSLGVYLTKNG